MKKVTVDLDIAVSHQISTPGFSGINEYSIVDGDQENGKIEWSEKFPESTRAHEFREHFERLARKASYAIAKKENNPQYGCPYFVVNWQSMKVEHLPETVVEIQDNSLTIHDNKLHIRDLVGLRGKTKVNRNDINRIIGEIPDSEFFLDSFFNGLKSNNPKAKFFHFFVIIECIEGSKEYKDMFSNNNLFSSDESKKVKKFAESFDNRKKGVILESLKRTKYNRKKKLLLLLESKNLEVLNNGTINEDDLGRILNMRNSLFHSSSSFDEELLYLKLFPLVREIVGKIQQE